MQKVIVIGGGLAGLSSAVFLAKRNIPVEVIEAAGRLGGRVTSFYDAIFGENIDNGQHIMMGCYKSTLEYLSTIGALQNFSFSDNLKVDFYKEGNIYSLKSPGSLYPFSLIKGLLSFKLISLKERLSLLGFFLMLPLSSTRDIQKLSAEQWLIEAGQSENIRKSFWDIFITGALNTTPARASALVLRDVLIRVFLSGDKSSSIILPVKPLAEAFCNPAVQYLKQRNSDVICSERILKLVPDSGGKRINKILTSRRIITGFSFIISAVPLYALEKIININYEFKPVYSPILNFYFRTERKIFEGEFIAIVDSPLHWVFSHNTHYVAVISSADDLAEKDPREVRLFFEYEMKKQFNLDPGEITGFKVIKERRATFIPSPGILDKRPGSITEYRNLVMAGDWTNTGLPATIEGAVESGKRASESVQL